MKKFLVVIAMLGFGFSAQAGADHNLEIQINGGFLGTAGGLQINDDKTGDNSPWSLGAEVYKSMGEKLQIGGALQVGDADTLASETTFTLAALMRFNFGGAGDRMNDMFVGGGLSYNDLGALDAIALHVQFGKRMALSEHITYTPNIEVQSFIGGDVDEGTSITINLLSFSGFM